MKKVAIIVLMTMFLGLMCAEMVDESLATTVALRFFENMSKATGVVHSTTGYSSFDTPEIDFYIVNFEPKGFVLVAADQRSQPILAFSTDFTFPHEDIPESIQHFISAYSKGMSEIRRHPEWKKDPNWANITSMNFSHYESRNSVEPMIETVWSQRWPYHLLCPEDPGSPGGRVRVGTMATAMGQVMKKWNYPHRGQGSNTYNAVGYGEQSANFGATIYNWQDMPDSVATENLSVATLLYHCGVAVNMRYGTDYSIADTYDARNALVNHFRYHDNAEIMYYITFAGDLISWRNRLKDELAVGRPLIYHAISAARDDGFILDGYRAEDYFHINWGWGGDRNGYYLLNNLNPGTANYYTDHQAIVNIYPQSHPENDLAAVKLSGNKFPNIDEQNSYRVRVVNSGLEIQDNYLVQLYLEDGTLIDQIAGEIILPQGVLEYDLNWTPDAQGKQIIYAKVQMDSDQDNDNDRSNDLIINVLGEDSILIETGDDDSFNNLSSQPSPYVSNVRLFRQQYLLLNTELSAAGANAGMLEALCFNVRYKHYCAPMPNYRIRFKHTDLNSLSSTFEPGDYQTVCQYDYYMPVEGWNTHLFDEPFIWDGLSNVIVDILTDQIVENIGDNASVYYTDTGFSSSLHNYAHEGTSSEFISGHVTTKRANMKLYHNSLAAGTRLLVSPSAIDFGDIVFGHTQEPKYINLSNVGSEIITLSANDFSLIGSEQFAFDSSLFPIVLEPTQALAFPVTITGTQEGATNATMRFNFEGEDYDVDLSANVWEDGLIIIGDGIYTDNLPAGSSYWHSYAQMIYKPDEILMTDRKLEKIAYHYDNTGGYTNNSLWTIYVGHTDVEAFASNSEWIDTSNHVEVFSGVVDIPSGEDWLEIDLGLHFIYNGEDNLVITLHKINDNTSLDYNEISWYNTYSYPPLSLSHYYLESTETLPSHGNPIRNRPNIKMFFADVPTEPVFSYLPESVNFGNVVYGVSIGPKNIVIMNQGRGSISLTANDIQITGSQAQMFSFDEDVFPVSLGSGESFVIPVSVFGVQEGAISATLVINYGGEGYEIELNANVWEENLVYIGDDTLNYNFPVNPRQEYSYTQFIYMPQEIMFARRQIENIAFYWNGVGAAVNTNSWNIYMGYTDKLAFDSSIDWIEPNGLTLVYQGNLTIPNQNMWIEIELDTPFAYNGTSKLVIAIHENQPGSDNVAGYFHNTASRISRSMEYVGSDTNIDPTNPPYGFPRPTYPNIRMRFNELPQNPIFALSPDIEQWDFGSNPIYFDNKKEFIVSNQGRDTLTIEDISVSGDGFTIEEEFVPTELGCLDSITFNAVYYPESTGDHQGTLTITHSLGSYEIELSGSCYDPIIYELPFFEGFEEGNIDGSALIDNWHQELGPDHIYKQWTANSSQTFDNREARSGDWNAVLGSNSEATLVRPIMLEGDHCYSLSFWARQDFTTYAGVKAILGENYRMEGTRIQIMPATNVIDGDYQEFYCEFTAPTTGLYYIGIYGSVISQAQYLSLDDISIKHYGKAVPPSNLQATVNRMKVMLDWDAPDFDAQTVRFNSKNELADMDDVKSGQELVLLGYNIYRNGYLAKTIVDPDITSSAVDFLANGNYVIEVSSLYNFGISLPISTEVEIDVEIHQGTFEDGFEDYPDFATEFAPWSQRSEDDSPTTQIDGIDFPGSGTKHGFMIFNPSQTTPPLTDITAYEGEKMVATFSAADHSNHDFLLTPRIQLGENSTVKFYARSHSVYYGFGHFMVGVYVDPAPFGIHFYGISGAGNISVPTSWTEYSFDLSGYANQNVYLAIYCKVPYGQTDFHNYIMYIDNFSITHHPVSTEDDVTPALKLTGLNGNYPNPFNPETTVSYSLAKAGHAQINIYNLKGQLVKRLVNSEMMAGEHEVIWNGRDDHNREVSSGVYLIRLNTGKHSSTKKMIMMK